MGIKEDLPNDIWREQFLLDKKIQGALAKIQYTEESVAKGMKELGERIQKAVREYKAYTTLQFESSRNYIQILNRPDASIVEKQDLQKLKEHIRRIEETQKVLTTLYGVLFDLAKSQRNYSESLRTLTKVQEKIVKEENEWANGAIALSKAKSKQQIEKLGKIEKEIRNSKTKIEKLYKEKRNKHNECEQTMVKLNKDWQNLKVNIKNIQW